MDKIIPQFDDWEIGTIIRLLEHQQKWGKPDISNLDAGSKVYIKEIEERFTVLISKIQFLYKQQQNEQQQKT